MFRRNRLLPSDYMLSGTLAENPGSALLYGEPGYGTSTLALNFAWQTQGAFDAVSFLRGRPLGDST
jgi:Flp pilus assembly CpaE family ATPase